MKYQILIKDSLKNTVENGKTVGFSFETKINNGRGCFLSLLDGFYISVDGVEYGRECQTIEIHGKPSRTLEELKHCCWEHWDPWETARVYVKMEGGLLPGDHEIVCCPCILEGYVKAQNEWVEKTPAPKAYLRFKKLDTLTAVCTIPQKEGNAE